MTLCMTNRDLFVMSDRRRSQSLLPTRLSKWVSLMFGSIPRVVPKVMCCIIFFPVFSVYFLRLDRSEGIASSLDFGIVTISAVLGGLVLNAGLSSSLPCEQRREFISVARKFIIVVILMIISWPTVRFFDSAGGVDTMSFDPGGPSAWGLFWIGVISFFPGVTVFIVALVDLVYVMFGLGGVSCGCKVSGKNNSCDARSDADAS